MLIKLTKAIEVLGLDLKEAGAKASPDLPDAVRLGLAGLKAIHFARKGGRWHPKALLEGEQPEEIE